MHLKHLTIGLLAIMIGSITACKKKDDAQPTINAIGSWRPTETNETLKYVIIGEDGYEHLLQSTTLGLHIKGSSAYTANTDQIYLEGSYFNNGGYFNYKVSNDSLYLEAPGFYKVLLRANDAPAPDAWVKSVNFTPQYPLPFLGNYGALEWDGTDFIILSGYIPKRMYKYNPVTQQTYDSVDIVERSYGFCYHNGGIWVNDYQNDDKLHAVNFATGAYTTNSVSSGTIPLIPASDGNKIWTFGSDNSKLYSYNTGTNIFTDEGTLDEPLFSSFSGSSSLGADMAIKDGHAYLVFGNLIGKFSLSTLRFVETYQIKNGGVIGIAYDGTDFWANGGNDLSDLSIGKLNLP